MMLAVAPSRERQRRHSQLLRSFKANFVKATLLWLPFLVVLIALAWSWIVLQFTPLLIIKFALTIIWLIGFEWVFALQARFENTVPVP